MIVWAYEELPSMEAFSHYQTIRRDETLVFFEPGNLEIAIAGVLSAARQFPLSASRTESWLIGQIQMFIERLALWRHEVSLQAGDLLRTAHLHRAKTFRNADASACLVADRYCGFFKASKPNLHNAP